MANLLSRIKDMFREINQHRRDRDLLIEYYVRERLETSLHNYDEDLNNSVDSLTLSDAKKVTKALNRRKS